MLHITNCSRLTCLPASFGSLSSLQHLVLEDTMATVAGCLYGHGNLRTLRLRSKAITSLQNGLFSSLSSLDELDLANCIQLTDLPHGVCDLSRLRHLDLENCPRLSSLPQDFGNLCHLAMLDLANAGMLTQLHDSFGRLGRLQDLDLCFCDRLKSLPDSFGNLSRLQYLRLNCCRQLDQLPTNFSGLVGLEELSLSYCESLHLLPAGFVRPSCMYDRGTTFSSHTEITTLAIGLALLDSQTGWHQ